MKRTVRGLKHPLLLRPARVLVVALACAALAACTNGETSQGNRNRSGTAAVIPVVIGDVVSKTVPVQIRVVGNVQAYASVTLKSQLDAEVAHVQVKEGQNVRKGDVLFLLDSRPWEATLNQAEAALNRDRAQLQQARAAVAQTTAAAKQAEANLARDQAQLENARNQLSRYQGLIAEGAISKELYDQVRTTAAALEATIQADQAAITNAQAMIEAAKATVENVQAQIKADEANIQNARVQLGYATIRAPMDAQAGNLLVRAGSAVKARDDTAQMLVLNQIHPIYVSFSVPEQYLKDIKKYQAARTLRVEAFPRGEEEKGAAIGELTFINNTVDATTGMIQLKATFQNSSGTLWPGQFVSVLVTLTTRPDSVVVPSQAIQTGQKGQYLYVVKPDNTVESRLITVAMRLGSETVIDKGVQPGDKVVVDGQVRLVPGARIQAKTGNGQNKTDTAEAKQTP